MDDEEFNEDIAAAMGFSSFGGAKKRKYDQTNSPKAKPDASGANNTKLGVRPKIVADDSSSSLGSGVASQTVGTVETVGYAGNASQSQPPSATETHNINAKQQKKQTAPSGLAAFLNRGQSLPDKPLKSEEPETAAPVVQEAGRDSAALHMISFGAEPIPQAELDALRRGVRDETGNIAYFLPSFVEDPWASLRKDQS